MNNLKGFKTILADPPWAFKTYSEKGMDRSAENHYECMTAQDIVELPVKRLRHRDAVLFLWVTNPMLELGLEVMDRWGFDYKSNVTWLKQDRGGIQIGTGYRVRACTELLLIGTSDARGAKTFCPAPSDRLVGAIIAPRTRHSAKPPEQWPYLEQYPGPSLELFARSTRPGWTSLGLEIDGLDIRQSIPRLIEALTVT